MGGQLQGPLRAVPAVPCELVLALLNAALGAGGHAAGVDQVGLQGQERTCQNNQWETLSWQWGGGDV